MEDDTADSSPAEGEAAVSPFSALTENLTPTVTVYNETPSSWQATIIEVGIKFIYQKWTNEPNSDVGGRTNIASGGNQTFRATINSCCAGYIDLVKIKDRSGKETVLSGSYNVPNETTCMLDGDIRIVPAKSVTIDKITGAELYYEVRRG